MKKQTIQIAVFLLCAFVLLGVLTWRSPNCEDNVKVEAPPQNKGLSKTEPVELDKEMRTTLYCSETFPNNRFLFALCISNRFGITDENPEIRAMPVVVMGSDRPKYLTQSIGALCDCFGMNKDDNLVIVSLDVARNDTVSAISSVLAEKECPFQLRIIFHELSVIGPRGPSRAKSHWWWMMHQIWEEKYLLGDYSGDVLFLEDDHVVSKDAYVVSRTMSEMKIEMSHTIPMWGTALSRDAMPALRGEVDPYEFVIVKHDWPPCPNMGYSFNRTLWSKIKQNEQHFMHLGGAFADWDNTMGHLMQRCVIPSVIIRPIVTRLVHVGESGLIPGSVYRGRKYNRTVPSNLTEFDPMDSRIHWRPGVTPQNLKPSTCGVTMAGCWMCSTCRVCKENGWNGAAQNTSPQNTSPSKTTTKKMFELPSGWNVFGRTKKKSATPD